MNNGKTLAVMRDVKFGVSDRGGVCLMFSAYTEEHLCAGHFVPLKEAAEFIRAYGVDDVSKLNGKTCWVKVDGMIQTLAGPAVF
jgi:hypothetical protein